MESGYYWIKLKDDEEIIIGYFDKEESLYPWTIIGSDEIFKSKKIEVLSKRIECSV